VVPLCLLEQQTKFKGFNEILSDGMVSTSAAINSTFFGSSAYIHSVTGVTREGSYHDLFFTGTPIFTWKDFLGSISPSVICKQ